MQPPTDLSSGFDQTVTWVINHPIISGITIFLVALLESLVIIGVLVPGALFMVLLGVLISKGAMSLPVAIAWAASGAIAGDAISFWIGHHYKDRLRKIWPFSRSQTLLAKGEAFFNRHGGKSIFFGRFVGPIRAIIPTIAGVLGMSAKKFAVVNILSALAWAPTYILPGLIVGATSGISFRLVIILIIIISLLLFTHWLVRNLFSFFQSHTEQLITQILAWSSRHRWIGPYTRALITPDAPAYKSLIITSSIFFIALLGFTLLLIFGNSSLGESGINLTLYNFLQSLRSPVADQVMVFFTMIASSWVYIPCVLVSIGWFASKKQFSAIIHLLIVALLVGVFTQVTKAIVASPRPGFILNHIGDNSASFPSGHVAGGLVVYGFISILIANGLKPRFRAYPYISIAVLLITIAFTRLYLGVHWLTDVVGALMLGLILLSLAGISFQRHLQKTYRVRSFIILISMTFIISIFAHNKLHFSEKLQQYKPHYLIEKIPSTQWWQNRWTTLPAYRYDLRNRQDQPLTIQYSGDIQFLKTQLLKQGWRIPADFKIRNMLHWFHSDPLIKHLPLLPNVHRGRHEILLLSKPFKLENWLRKMRYIIKTDTLAERHRRLLATITELFDNRQRVIRLWHADTLLLPGKKPLYIGNVSTQRLRRPMDMLAYPSTGDDFHTPLLELLDNLGNFDYQEVKRQSLLKSDKLIWNNKIILIREKTKP